MDRRTIVMYAAGASTLIAILVGGWWAWHRGLVYSQNGTLHISFAAIENPVPSLDRPINFPSDFDDNAKTIFNQDLAKTKAALQANPNDVSSWLDLAIDYRLVNDQIGAVEIWKYISAKYPTEGVSLHNLGEYYFHTAKNYPLAEDYYMRSIAVAPTMGADYTDLHEMYQYVYKQNTTAAADILKEGIAKVGAEQAIDLMTVLADYYRDSGDKADALTYYKQALAGAKAANNPQLVNQLDQEIAKLQ